MLAIAAVCAAGIAINVVGAFYGAMYCDVQVYAFWPALAALQGGGLKDLPLAKWLVVPAILSLFLLIYSLSAKQERGHAPFLTMS